MGVADGLIGALSGAVITGAISYGVVRFQRNSEVRDAAAHTAMFEIAELRGDALGSAVAASVYQKDEAKITQTRDTFLSSLTAQNPQLENNLQLVSAELATRFADLISPRLVTVGTAKDPLVLFNTAKDIEEGLGKIHTELLSKLSPRQARKLKTLQKRKQASRP